MQMDTNGDRQRLTVHARHCAFVHTLRTTTPLLLYVGGAGH